MQALVYTTLWRPVDPEVEDYLAQETTVVKTFPEHDGDIRPPCGYGLLHAKEEARKVRALRSLMRVGKDFKVCRSEKLLTYIRYLHSCVLCSTRSASCYFCCCC